MYCSKHQTESRFLTSPCLPEERMLRPSLFSVKRTRNGRSELYWVIAMVTSLILKTRARFGGSFFHARERRLRIELKTSDPKTYGRFGLDSGHWADMPECPSRARSGLMQRNKRRARLAYSTALSASSLQEPRNCKRRISFAESNNSTEDRAGLIALTVGLPSLGRREFGYTR